MFEAKIRSELKMMMVMVVMVVVVIGSRMMRIILEVCLRQQRRAELMDLPEFPSPGQSHLCANPQIWHCHTPPAWQCWQFGEN